MKNIFTGLVLFCIVLASCKKDNKKLTSPSNKLVKVTFGVADFSEQHVGFATNSLKITNALIRNDATPIVYVPAVQQPLYNEIFYLVYDSNGKYVHQINQYQGNPGFGTINDQLSPGKYSIFIIGGQTYGSGSSIKKELKLFNSLGYIPSQQFFYYLPYNGSTTPLNDTFYKSISLDLTDEGTNQNIVLNRIVGQLNIVIQDAIPAGITKIHINATPSSSIFMLSTGLAVAGTAADPEPYDADFPIASNLIGTTNYGMSNILGTPTIPTAVTITAMDSSGNIIAQKTISNVMIKANTQTILQGNLFGDAGTGSTVTGTTLAADTGWITAPITYHF